MFSIFQRKSESRDRVMTDGTLIFSADAFLTHMISGSLKELGVPFTFKSEKLSDCIRIFDESQIDIAFIDVRNDAIKLGKLLRALANIPGYRLNKLILYFIGEPGDLVLPQELRASARYISAPISSSQMIRRLGGDLLPHHSKKLKKLYSKDRRAVERGSFEYFKQILDQLVLDVGNFSRQSSHREKVLMDGSVHVQQCLHACGAPELAEKIGLTPRDARSMKKLVNSLHA